MDLIGGYKYKSLGLRPACVGRLVKQLSVVHLEVESTFTPCAAS